MGTRPKPTETSETSSTDTPAISSQVASTDENAPPTVPSLIESVPSTQQHQQQISYIVQPPQQHGIIISNIFTPTSLEQETTQSQVSTSPHASISFAELNPSSKLFSPGREQSRVEISPQDISLPGPSGIQQQIVKAESIPSVSPKKTEKCSRCDRRFTTPAKLSAHVRSVHETGTIVLQQTQFSCEHCNKSFSSKFKLVRHALIHSDRRPFQCTVCERTFHRKDHLKNHIKVHSPTKKVYVCDRSHCNKEYTSALSYKKHLAIHSAEEGNLDCKICSKIFETKSDILYHLKIHAGSRTLKNPNEKKYRCEFCERRFFTRKDVRRHLVVHTGRRDFLCQFCPQRFGRKDHLVRHIKKSHSGEEPTSSVIKQESDIHLELSTIKVEPITYEPIPSTSGLYHETSVDFSVVEAATTIGTCPKPTEVLTEVSTDTPTISSQITSADENVSLAITSQTETSHSAQQHQQISYIVQPRQQHGIIIGNLFQTTSLEQETTQSQVSTSPQSTLSFTELDLSSKLFSAGRESSHVEISSQDITLTSSIVKQESDIHLELGTIKAEPTSYEPIPSTSKLYHETPVDFGVVEASSLISVQSEPFVRDDEDIFEGVIFDPPLNPNLPSSVDILEGATGTSEREDTPRVAESGVEMMDESDFYLIPESELLPTSDENSKPLPGFSQAFQQPP